MKAETLAKQLEQAGVTVKSFKEGDDQADGAVYITDRVHVQVAVFGDYMNVVRETPDHKYKFYPESSGGQQLIEAIRTALEEDKNA